MYKNEYFFLISIIPSGIKGLHDWPVYEVELPLLQAVQAGRGLVLSLVKWIHFFSCPWLEFCQFTDISNQIELTKNLLENGWNSKQMITEGEAAIPLETTLRAFRNQEKTKQRSIIVS